MVFWSENSIWNSTPYWVPLPHETTGQRRWDGGTVSCPFFSRIQWSSRMNQVWAAISQKNCSPVNEVTFPSKQQPANPTYIYIYIYCRCVPRNRHHCMTLNFPESSSTDKLTRSLQTFFFRPGAKNAIQEASITSMRFLNAWKTVSELKAYCFVLLLPFFSAGRGSKTKTNSARKSLNIYSGDVYLRIPGIFGQHFSSPKSVNSA